MMKPVKITTDTRGEHPTRTSRWPTYGAPLPCSASVVALVSPDKVTVSMNGTAVFTQDEWRAFMRQIGMTLTEVSK